MENISSSLAKTSKIKNHLVLCSSCGYQSLSSGQCQTCGFVHGQYKDISFFDLINEYKRPLILKNERKRKDEEVFQRRCFKRGLYILEELTRSIHDKSMRFILIYEFLSLFDKIKFESTYSKLLLNKLRLKATENNDFNFIQNQIGIKTTYEFVWVWKFLWLIVLALGFVLFLTL